MIHKTRGIVLRTVSYSDTSIITKIYTEEFGVQSYLVKGAKRKNASIKANLFQPLSLLDLVVYNKEKKKLQILKEASVEFHYSSIPADPAKTSVLFFMNELLLKCLQEEENNPELFSFLHESMQTLEAAEKNFSNFYLIFMVRLARFLGFYPQGKASETTPYFDLQEGQFVNSEPLHPNYLGKTDSALLSSVITGNYYSMESLSITGQDRRSLLDVLLRFYHLHLSNMGSISSHKVLEQVFA